MGFGKNFLLAILIEVFHIFSKLRNFFRNGGFEEGIPYTFRMFSSNMAEIYVT